MRKVFIISGLLMVSVSLTLLISAEKSHVFKSGKIPGKNHKIWNPHPTLIYSQDTLRTHDIWSVKDKNTSPILNKKEMLLLEKYRKLSEKTEQLEKICNECRLVLEKAGIDDSVYDPFDNPEGRVSKYEIDRTVERLFNASKMLKIMKLQQENLKKQYNVRE